MKQVNKTVQGHTINKDCAWCHGKLWVKVPSLRILRGGDPCFLHNNIAVFCHYCFSTPPSEKAMNIHDYISKIKNDGCLQNLRNYIEYEGVEFPDIYESIDAAIVANKPHWWHD